MKHLMPNEEKLSGVSLVRAVLANLHESLKWLWLIVMGLAVVNAVEIYAQLLDPAIVDSPLTLVNMFLTQHSIVFISFILVFVRFYFGDSRFLDLSYEETHYRLGLRGEVKKYSGTKQFLDIMLLLNHGIFFYFMSFHMGNATHYVYFFMVLMLVNVFWLLLQVVVGTKAHDTDPDPLIGNVKSYQPMLIWSINNLFFVLVISYFMFSSFKHRIAISLALTLINSCIDLATTWHFYFPPLKKILDVAVSTPSEQPKGETAIPSGAEG